MTDDPSLPAAAAPAGERKELTPAARRGQCQAGAEGAPGPQGPGTDPLRGLGDQGHRLGFLSRVSHLHAVPVGGGASADGRGSRAGGFSRWRSWCSCRWPTPRSHAAISVAAWISTNSPAAGRQRQFPLGTKRRNQRDHAGTDEKSRDLGDPPDVFHPCLIAAAEIAVDAMAEIVAVRDIQAGVERSAEGASVISSVVPI